MQSVYYGKCFLWQTYIYIQMKHIEWLVVLYLLNKSPIMLNSYTVKVHELITDYFVTCDPLRENLTKWIHCYYMLHVLNVKQRFLHHFIDIFFKQTSHYVEEILQ